MNPQILDEIALSVENGASPWQIKAVVKQQGNQLQTPVNLRFRICDDAGYAVASSNTIAPVSGKGVLLAANTANKDLDLTTATGVQATGTLTFSGVVVEGETVTIGSVAYKFNGGGLSAADLVGFTAVDVSADGTASQGTLTVATQPTALDSMRIGAKTYTFVAAGTAAADGEIALGADLAATKPLIVAAINGTDGVNTAHPLVTAAAFATNDCVITAKTVGVAGDAIATIEGFTAVGNVFDAATLGTTTAGVDVVAADAAAALVAADANTDVTLTDAGSGVVTATAVTAGTTANAIATTETCANGAFGAATLAGGIDALPGEIWVAATVAGTSRIRVSAAAFGSPAAHYEAAYIDVTTPA